MEFNYSQISIMGYFWHFKLLLHINPCQLPNPWLFYFLDSKYSRITSFPGGQAENISEFPGLHAKPMIGLFFFLLNEHSIPLDRASSLSTSSLTSFTASCLETFSIWLLDIFYPSTTTYKRLVSTALSRAEFFMRTGHLITESCLKIHWHIE